MRNHKIMVVRYYIFNKIRSYVQWIIKIIWIYETLLYSTILDFEIIENFWSFFLRCFGVQILGTMGYVKIFVQRNCESVLNFKIYTKIKL